MALEVVGGAFISAFFQQVFRKMDSQEVKNFIRGKKRTDGLLRKLRVKLLSVNAVFDDAEQKQLRNPDVKQWLHELKEAVLDAEDLLDKIKTEALTRKMEAEFRSSTKKVQKFISASFHAFDESVDTKIEEILERLGFIAEQKDAFDLKVGGRHIVLPTLPSTSLVEESDVYGRDHERKAIIELLLSNDATSNKIGVIPIVGMGGIGKTTLAQLVFNDVRVKQHFDPRVWVCVSEEFDVVKITQTIYSSVTTTRNSDITDLNEIQVALKEALTGKKFLFVLDDVWNEDYNRWDSLSRPFASGAHGSKIIVTTRNEPVARVMGTFEAQHLMEISDEDSWLLFAKHAFTNGIVDPKVEVIGRQIVRKIKGLPLASKSLGGLLRSESNVEEWENVLKSDIWKLSDTNFNILPALWLSYQYLSPHLKRCFAYCSIYPKDYEFCKSEVVLLWMAEDLLQPNKKKTMEEVGENFFNDLISRSFFQCASSSDNCFNMHDLINDLAKFVSGEFCVRLEDGDSLDSVSKARHFSCVSNAGHLASLKSFDHLHEAKYLRSFLLDNFFPFRKIPLDLLLTLRCLRVLKLHRYDMAELPDSISNLKLLRYLDLCGTRIRKLPDTTGRLYNLQTLLLSMCSLLAELPASLGRLINLRHLDIRGTKIKKMPPQMGKLKDLQTLGGIFVLDKHTGGNIAELKGFHHLRGVLHISGLQYIVHAEDALEAKMRDKEHLDEINFVWEGATEKSVKDRQVLGNLQPHTNLKKLRIECYGGITFPGWLGDESFFNLVSLQLVACKYCLFMPALGQLPSLTRLEIEGLHAVESLGSDFYGGIKPAFRSLQVLRFYGMQEWQEWSFDGGKEGRYFPNLRELSLEYCPKLTGKVRLDYCFPRLERLNLLDVGLESLGCSQESCNSGRIDIELLSLRELNISKCPNLVCFVAGGLLHAPKLTDIYINGIKNLWSQPEELYISLRSLQSMQIQMCKELESFPQESDILSLCELQISKCPNFLGFADGSLLHVPNLYNIVIQDCDKFRSLPERMHSVLPSLKSMSLLWCQKFESFPGQSNQLPSLVNLKIVGCPNFVGFPPGGLHAPHLKVIEILICEKCRSLPLLEEMHTLLPSLRSIHIRECQQLESFSEESNQFSPQLFLSLCELRIAYCGSFVGFPHAGGLHAPKITSIEIGHCDKLRSLPQYMHTLFPSLRSLDIYSCPELEAFPEGGLPSKLESLQIQYCKKLIANGMQWGLQRLKSLRLLIVSFVICEEIGESFLEKDLLPTTLTSIKIIRMPRSLFTRHESQQAL